MAEFPPERSVFVVHGRNEKARKAMFDFLRAIDLRPIEWEKAVAATDHASPPIGEILDSAFGEAKAVVVLFTPDDEARLRPEWHRTTDGKSEIELTGQARPNVFFEAGLAMGRDAKRTVLVTVGRWHTFSDIAGRHVVHLEDSSEMRHTLANRLATAGCQVDLDGNDWLKAGDFKAAIAASNFDEPVSDERDSIQGETLASSPALSDGAAEMLRRADADTSKRITIGPAKIGSLAIIAGSYPFDLSSSREGAKSRAAHKELVEMDMIEKTSQQIDRSHYAVTDRGFRWLEEHGNSKIVSVLTPAISSDGTKLLCVAVDADGPIVRKLHSEGMDLKIGRHTFHTRDTPSPSKWPDALWELEQLELVEEGPDDVFSVTGKGLHFADRLGH